MPSQIKVDEIKNVAGQYKIKTNVLEGQTTAGSIDVVGEGNSTTTNLQQGLAKVWCKLSGAAQTINDSFNLSSRTDNGVGQTELNFSSAFGSSHFSKTALADFDGSIDNGLHAYGSDGQSSGATPSTTKTRIDVLEYTTTNDGDCGYISGTLHGDLA
tara:strand:- start:550 stop:1020 length:471 start_codon:yes stop_codon:yes gene_type:complete